MKCIILATGLLVSTINFASAANDPATIEKATSLLEGNQPQAAYDLLKSGYDVNAATAQELFLLGVAANQSGDYPAAKGYFEKVIELDPNAARAKLELATVIFNMGQSEKAKQLLLDVKALNPPPNVNSNIDRFLAAIEARENQPEKKNWRVTVSMGRQYDSNVNGGPETDSVLMYGLPFTLSDSAQENSDQAWLVKVSGDYILPIRQDLSWQSNLSFSRTDYGHVQSLDADSVSVSTGPTWQQNNQLVWSLPVVADRQVVGHDASYYSYGFGIAPQVRFAVDPKLNLGLAGTLAKKKYRKASTRTQSSFSITPSVNYKLTEQDSFRLGLTGGRQASGLVYYTNRSLALSSSWYHTFSESFVAALNASYTDTSYRGKEAAYDYSRHDKAAYVGLDLTYHHKNWGTDLIFSTSYTDTRSTLEMYRNDRAKFSFTMRRSF